MSSVGRATRALFLRGKMLKKKSQHPPSFGGVRRRPLSKAQEHFPGACAMLRLTPTAAECRKRPPTSEIPKS